MALNPCPNCGKRGGKLADRRPARFPFAVVCSAYRLEHELGADRRRGREIVERGEEEGEEEGARCARSLLGLLLLRRAATPSIPYRAHAPTNSNKSLRGVICLPRR